MYKEYYGLNHDPFRAAADFYNLYSHPTLAKARSYLQYGLQVGEGVILVSGHNGIGKTTLVNSVISTETSLELDPVIVDCSDYSGAELLSHIARILSGEDHRPDIPDALNIITHALVQSRAEGRQPLLVLDEAHKLKADALQKLLLITNLQVAGEQLVQIFLIGLPSLRETLLLPEHAPLHQRLVATCKIAPLTEAETKEYIQHKLLSAGWTASPAISPNVHTAVYKTSIGIPRWINLICSRLLLHGMVNQRETLDLDDACEVLRELLTEDLLPAAVRRSNDANSLTLQAA